MSWRQLCLCITCEAFYLVWNLETANVKKNVLILELNSVFDHFLWFRNDLQNESAKTAEFWLSPRKLQCKIRFFSNAKKAYP